MLLATMKVGVISKRITSDEALTVSLASESCQYALSISSGEALPVSLVYIRQMGIAYYRRLVAG
jgi:hypothetical protein